MEIEDHVVEDFASCIHSKGSNLQIVADDLLVGLQIACLDEHLLKFQKIQMNVLVLLQKGVLVMSRFQLLILGSYVSNCSFHLLLHVFDVF